MTKKSKLLSLAGAVCLSIPIFFLEHTAAAGVLCLLGLLLLLCGGKTAAVRSEAVWNGVLLWAGHSIRFCGLFGTQFTSTLLCFLIFIPYSALLSVGIWGERRLHRAGHPFAALLVVPVVYAALAYLLAGLNLGFVSNLMSYPMCIPAFSGNLPCLGEYGMTFALMLILTALSFLCTEKQKKLRILYGGTVLLLLVLLLSAGTILYRQYKEPDYTIEAALATSQEMDYLGENGVVYSEEAQLDMFSTALETAVADGAQLLILNEEYFCWPEEGEDLLYEAISEFVRASGIPVLAGIELVREDTLSTNEAVYFDGDGEILATYVKNNLVPFIEASEYEDGPDDPALLQVTIGGHTIDLAIVVCFDLNDEAYLRKIPASTTLLIAPSWDWDTGNIEQKRTCIRASSLGLTLCKHTFDGFSYVSCPNGDCTETIDLRKCYETVVPVSIPIWEK